MGQNVSEQERHQPEQNSDSISQRPVCKNIPRVIKSIDGFEDDPRKLNRLLEAFTTVQVKRDEDETRRARSYVMGIVEKILEEVKDKDSKFDFVSIRAGSDFQRVAVNSSSDFDIVLEFKNFPPVKSGTSSQTWTTVEFVNSCSPWPRTAVIDGKLSSQIVRSTFAQRVQDAVRTLGYRNVSVSTHGPAIYLKISDGDDNFEVDLVPAIKTTLWPSHVRRFSSEGTHFVAKLHPNGNEPNRKVLWSISFVAAENSVLRQYDPGCRRQTLRILKALNEKHIGPPLTSYHLKSIWMYECYQKYPEEEDWERHKLGERFLGLMSSLQKCLDRCYCPHFFIQDLNLFEIIDKQHLRGLGDKVGKIMRNPAKYLDLDLQFPMPGNTPVQHPDSAAACEIM